MPLSDIFDTGRKPRVETFPFSPGQEAVTAYQQRVLPEISALVGGQAPIVGRSAAAGLLGQPENLRALAEQYFPTTQPTTPEAAVAAALPGVAGPLGRRFTEETAPNLQALMAGFGAARSGQGVRRAGELYRQQVSDPLSEAMSRTAVQQAQFNQAQDFARRQAQVGLLAPQDQTIAALLGQTLAIQPPEQTVMGMPGEQMGIGTQLGVLGAYNALSSGLGALGQGVGAAAAAAGKGGAGADPTQQGGAIALIAAGLGWVWDTVKGLFVDEKTGVEVPKGNVVAAFEQAESSGQIREGSLAKPTVEAGELGGITHSPAFLMSQALRDRPAAGPAAGPGAYGDPDDEPGRVPQDLSAYGISPQLEFNLGPGLVTTPQFPVSAGVPSGGPAAGAPSGGVLPAGVLPPTAFSRAEQLQPPLFDPFKTDVRPPVSFAPPPRFNLGADPIIMPEAEFGGEYELPEWVPEWDTAPSIGPMETWWE